VEVDTMESMEFEALVWCLGHLKNSNR
jgi:hypothetical protein